MTHRRFLCFVLWLNSLAGMLDVGEVRAEPKPASRLHVAGIVLKWIRADKDANYRRIEPLIREAAVHGAQLVVTAECFLDAYSAEHRTISEETYRALAAPIPGRHSFQRLADLARELKMYLVAGIV